LSVYFFFLDFNFIIRISVNKHTIYLLNEFLKIDNELIKQIENENININKYDSYIVHILYLMRQKKLLPKLKLI